MPKPIPLLNVPGVGIHTSYQKEIPPLHMLCGPFYEATPSIPAWALVNGFNLSYHNRDL